MFRKLGEDGAKDELPRAEAWLTEAPRPSLLASVSRVRQAGRGGGPAGLSEETSYPRLQYSRQCK